MHLKLSRLNHSIKATHFRAYDTELDDIRSILMDACRLLENHVIFLVSGFGQDRWPVDTGTDLPVFLEQLPHVLKAVKNSEAIDIDFYEQGVERLIRLTPCDTGDRYFLHCTGRLDWVPNPSCSSMDRDRLLEMLCALSDDFMVLITALSPCVAAHPWVVRWKELASAPRP